jgi:hypothetical protein
MLWLVVGACGCTGTSTGGSGGDASGIEDSGPGRDGPKPDTAGTCNVPECLRPYNCRLTCSGPILSSSCCPCVPPSFDDICCSRDACTP